MFDADPPQFPYPAAVVGSFGLAVMFSAASDQPVARFALGLMLLLFGCWFVRAFVSNPLYIGNEPQRQANPVALRDMYRFAYVFALIAFALLMLPFTSLSRDSSEPDAGPIRIMRGCVMPEFAATVPAPAPALGAASAVAQRADPNSPLPACRDKVDRYPVLLSVGGAVAQQVALPASAPAAKGAASAAAPSYYKVSGGLVVPVFVVALGFVGGAVSLTRKLPEYQRRTEPEFAGTTQDLPLQPYEAREFVVFQILQLVTAPMLAILAFEAFAPQAMAVAVAVAQAFFAGFASEWVLLRIRLIVDGPKPVATEAANRPRSTLTVTVKDAQAQGVAGATVELRRTQSGPVEANGTTNAAGQFAFRDLDAGAVFVRATAAGRQSLLQTSQLALGGNQVELVLA